MTLLAFTHPFIPPWADLRPFAAELWIILTIVAVLITPFFTRRSNLACAAVAFAGLGIALVSLLVVGIGPDVVGPRFSGMLVADHFSMLWKAMLLVFVMGILLMWFATTSSSLHEGDGPEFFTLLLGATLGMCLMAGTSNLLMIFMAVEMASLPSYVMAGFRKTHRVGAEASLKYVLFGAATSAVMVYGLSLLYGIYGTLQLSGVDGLAARMSATPASSALLAVSIFGLIVGVGFKISAVPFHFWCPDVFEGASIDVSAFLSVASKGAALVLLLRALLIIADTYHYQNAPNISLTAIAAVIGTIGAITATVGNTAAFVQTNIKRLLAYSSIAHAGYMLCALSLLVNHDNRQTVAGFNGAAQTVLLYLAVYLFMNLGAFTCAGLIWRETGSELIADYAGMGRRSPVLAVCMACCMFSLVGIPPFAGFVAKVNVLWVLIQNGGWWWVLVAVIGLNTILSLYYYLRVVKVMYLNDSQQPAFAANPIGTALAMVCSVMLLFMLFAYGPLTNLTHSYSRVYSVTGQRAPIAAAPGPATRPVAAAIP